MQDKPREMLKGSKAPFWGGILVETCPARGSKPRSRDLGWMSNGVRLVARAGGQEKKVVACLEGQQCWAENPGAPQ